MRGYTTYTRIHGDEAAARLAEQFTTRVGQVVVEHGGAVIGNAGDQVVAVFDSARRAIRSAIAIQELLAGDESGSDQIQAGVGLEAGEAEVVEGGYVSGALNIASRLCALAAPGQVLASDVVTTLAGHVEGVLYKRRRSLRLRGINVPVLVAEVYPEPVPEPPPAPEPAAGAAALRPRARRRRMIAAAAAAVAAGAAVAVLAARFTGSGVPTYALPVPPGQWAVEIDPSSHARVTTARVGDAPGAIAAHAGVAWVADAVDGTVQSVSDGGTAGQTVRIGGAPAAVAFDGRRVWVADSATDQVATFWAGGATPDALRLGVGNGPVALAPDRGAVWVASATDGTVAHLGPTGALPGQLRIPVEADPSAIAVDRRYVWVVNAGAGTLTRIARGDSSSVTEPVGTSPAAVAAGSGPVWVADRSSGTITRLDDAFRPSAIISGVGVGVTAMAFAGGSLWVATAGGDPRLTQVDTARGRVVARYDLGGAVTSVAAASGHVWATVVSPVSGHTGGSLTVATTGKPTLDPASADDRLSREILSMTGDGLVAFRHAPGAAGAAVVPDLAVAVPAPQNNQYVFQLRLGPRYPNGEPVGPQDIKRAIVRLFRLNPAAAELYGSIEGAQKCLAGTAELCTLREGIQVNADARTISFQLRRPDADFLSALALPYADAVPADTPMNVRSTTPLQGTGPYRIASIADGRLVLRRNPEFRQWSADAQPAGVPDEIDIQTGLDARTARHAGADLIHIDVLPVNGAALTVLERETARVVHAGVLPQTWYVYFNVRSPSRFARDKSSSLRTAVNYAVSRGRIAHAFGDRAAAPSCRILPPPLPGSRHSCRFSANPGRPWTSPDIKDAAASKQNVAPFSLSQHIDIETPSVAWPIAADLEADLRRLGFTSVSIDRHSHAYPGLLANVSPLYEIGIWRRTADVPSPYQFIDPVLGCPPAPADLAQFCGQQLSARMLEHSPFRTPPGGAASGAWADIDSRLESQAAWAPLVNTRWIDSTSGVGHYEYNPWIGTLLDQLWVM